MIVQATQRKTIDVEIDPIGVIHDIEESWKVMCRLPISAELRAGYWTREERAGHDTETVRIRLATQQEMQQYNAFETVREVARDL
jgi:hypothetical protein